MKNSEKKKITYTNTLAIIQLIVSSYALSIHVYHSSFLKTNAFMPVIPVFNNADAFMPFCRRDIFCHF